MTKKRKRNELLSEQAKKLLHCFHFINQSYTFLTQKNRPLHLPLVLAFSNQLLQTQHPREQITSTHVNQLVTLSKQEMQITNQATEYDDSDQLIPVLMFPNFPKSTKTHTNKREQLMHDKMLEYLHQQHNLFLQEQQLPKLNAIPTKWHHLFKVEAIEFPSVEPTLAAAAGQPPSSDESLLDYFKQMPSYRQQICHTETFDSKMPTVVEFPDDSLVPPELVQTCQDLGIPSLFSHQLDAIQRLQEQAHVVLSTSTSSGKSLVYNLTAIYRLLQDPEAIAVYLFPTKALAQDQLKTLKLFLSTLQQYKPHTIECCTYDGDTPKKERRSLVASCNIFLTNPDMLHHTIIPSHEQHGRILRRCKLVVIDEVHYYSGAFGSHVSLILYRFLRVAYHLYQNSVQVFASSATIANPLQHFRLLVPNLPLENGQFREVRVITKDGSPSGEKTFVLWNLSFQEPENQPNAAKKESDQILLGRAPPTPHRSPAYAAAFLFCHLMKKGKATLLFCSSRKQLELTLKKAKDILRLDPAFKGLDLLHKFKGYRGGYSIPVRRSIEGDMFSGRLLGIIATNALELGIDIGVLDATIQLGVPYSNASMWQQAGRAGRNGKASYSFIVAYDSPFDQYYIRYPSELFHTRSESVFINPFNRIILQDHINCASAELAYSDSVKELDFNFLMARSEQLMEDYPAHPEAIFIRHLMNNTRRVRPSSVNIRQIYETQFSVVIRSNPPETIDEIPQHIAFFIIYPGAIYLYQGDEYIVEDLNLEKREAYVRRITNPNYFTKVRDFTDVDAIKAYKSTSRTSIFQANQNGLMKTTYSLGMVQILTRIAGFYKRHKQTFSIVDYIPLSLPAIEHEATGVWVDLPPPLCKLYSEQIQDEKFRHLGTSGATHVINHVFQSVISMFLLCQPSDLATEHTSPHQHRQRPSRVYLYETYQLRAKQSGGVGLVSFVYENLPMIFRRIQHLLETCNCAKGCPRCCHDALCSEYNEALDKQGAIFILKYLVPCLEKESTEVDVSSF